MNEPQDSHKIARQGPRDHTPRPTVIAVTDEWGTEADRAPDPAAEAGRARSRRRPARPSSTPRLSSSSVVWIGVAVVGIFVVLLLLMVALSQ